MGPVLVICWMFVGENPRNLFNLFPMFSPLLDVSTQGSLKEKTVENLEKYVVKDVSEPAQ